MNLQFFAEGEGGSGEGDDQSEEGEDGEGDDQNEPEKKYSEADLTAAIEKRLIRERKKWQKQQAEGTKTEEGTEKETNNEKAVLEAKIACYEAGVLKDAVDDVSALANAYMQKDPELDLEEAIEKVVKKYPSFTKVTEQLEEKPANWGQRQGDKGAKKLTGVEARFLELNPGLKI